MSSGGDGKGFFDDLVDNDTFSGKGNFFENLVKDGLKYTSQYLSGGLVSVEDGKNVRAGVTGKPIVDGLKVITGAKAAEDANNMAREQFEEQKIAADRDRQESITRKGREQIMASQLAGAARRAGTSPTNNVPGTLLGSAEKDFLGL